MNTSAAISVFPASFAQRRLWFIQHFAPQSAAYNMVVSLDLPASTRADHLQRALDLLCARHETLRTAFALQEGDVVQRVATEGGLPLQLHTLATRDAFVPIISAAAARPFVLDASPLARAHLGSAPGVQPVLALVLHHIIADGATLQILLDDLLALLHGQLSGQPVALPQAPIEYADYAVWQRQWLSGPRLQALTDYWRQRLHALPALDLPGRRAGVTSTRGRVVPLRLPPVTCAGLQTLAAASRATLFGVLLAGLAVLLARLSGQRDFGIGLPVSGRNRVELERVAGLFVNSLVFRAVLPEGASFAELVRDVAGRLVEDLSHQELPFERVVDALRVRRDADRNPLFQVMLQLHQPAAPAPRQAPPRELLDPDQLSAQLELSFILQDMGDGCVEGGIVYAAERFDAAWIAQLASSWQALLAAAAQAPLEPFTRLPLLDDAGRSAALAYAEGPRGPVPPGLLHDGFFARARYQPDAPALRGAGHALGAGALAERALGLAAALQAAGVKPGDVVALCTRASADAIAAMIATLACGAAYLVIDPDAPDDYREFLLQDCGTRMVVVPAQGEALACGRPLLTLGTVRPSQGFEPVAASPQSAAYVIYTSGSTGRPKGVRIPHAAAVNHMHWMSQRFDIGPDDRVLQRTPLSFDASVWEVWVPLLSGATLVLAEHGGPFDPTRLALQLRRHAVTVLQTVPSLLGALLPCARDGELESLRLLFCGGEVLRPELARAAHAACGATLVNLYGPSETTIDACFHVCTEGEPVADCADVPIGRPVDNVVLRVLDDQLGLLPWGVPGELCIGGAAVGLGYIGRDALTAERFIDDPYAAGGRLYRSGDIVRMADDGALHYIGRRDGQIKLRGFRIELGEVEARLSAHPAVAEAAAVVQTPAEGDQRLIAFASLHADHAPADPLTLLAWLRAALPAHAVPHGVLLLDALPRSAHGKIDRAALREQAPGRGSGSSAWRAPAGTLEGRICAGFARHLGLITIGGDDDFFLLGGHSLLVIQVCADLSRTLEMPVGVVDMFECPTPRALAALLQARHGPSRAVIQPPRLTLRGAA